MVSAVVLAAGQSKRMGEKKELLPICDQPMILQVMEKLLRSKRIDEIIVVLGHRADAVGLALSGISDERVEFVGNARYPEGMGTSLAQGARACSWGTETILVVLADAPFFRVEDVERLIDAAEAGAGIVVPVYAGRRGHPVAFAGSYRDRLEALEGDAGARAILEKEADSVVEIETEDEWFLVDIDERDDYEAVKNRGGDGLP